MSMNNQKAIFVYENWSSYEPILLGTLFSQYSRGEETFSFEYDKEWLKNNRVNVLDPDLDFFNGQQFATGKRTIFGIFMDSEPDRWGRMLMKRREKSLALKENRQEKILTETDYLLGVEDFSRMGALRFSLSKGGEFLNNDKEMSTPPIAKLRDLEFASSEYEKENSKEIDKWLKILVAPGSSLGGARPKANVIDVDGSLWIAKFPSKNDENDSGAWEFVVHELAKLCGLNVPQAKLVKFSKNGSTFLVKRFDRDGNRRIHFASAMTLLGKLDGDSNECSYLDLVEFIKSYGNNVREDLIELWKRVVFNIAVSNTDDHLRNHGFILDKNAWKLSPQFDVNANPDGTNLSLNIDENNSDLSFDLALDTAKYYDIKLDDAKKMLDKIKTVVKDNWQKIARENGISESAIRNMARAFEK